MKFVTISLILFTLVSLSCKSDSTGPTSSGNLITNHTFEKNGILSLAGWSYTDTASFSLSDDIPPGTTGHSLEYSDKPSMRSIQLTTPAQIIPGKNVYRVSCWIKTNSGSNVEIYFMKDYRGRGYAGTGESWQQIFRTDTMTVEADDEITIILSPVSRVGNDSLVHCWMYNPRFEILD